MACVKYAQPARPRISTPSSVLRAPKDTSESTACVSYATMDICQIPSGAIATSVRPDLREPGAYVRNVVTGSTWWPMEPSALHVLSEEQESEEYVDSAQLVRNRTQSPRAVEIARPDGLAQRVYARRVQLVFSPLRTCRHAKLVPQVESVQTV